MIERLIEVELILADDDICDGFLVVFGDGLGYSPDLGSDEEGELQGHCIVGYFHLCMTDRQLYLRRH